MCVCVYKHAFCPASPDQSEWVDEGGGEIRTSLRDGLALHLTSLEEGAWDQTRGPRGPTEGGLGQGYPLGVPMDQARGRVRGVWLSPRRDVFTVQQCPKAGGCLRGGEAPGPTGKQSGHRRLLENTSLKPRKVPLWWWRDQSHICCQAGLSRVQLLLSPG